MFKVLKAWIKEKKHPFYTNQNRKYKHITIGDYTFGKPSIYGGENGQEETALRNIKNIR